MSSDKNNMVGHRRVFYIPGYDPFPARRYRELYRREAARQAEISGYEIALTPKEGGGFGWCISAEMEGQRTGATLEVLVWSDLVKDSMKSGVLGTYRALCRTAWLYLRTGALWRLSRLRKGPVIAALYPVAMLLLQLVLALVIGGVGGAGVAWVIEGALRQVGDPGAAASGRQAMTLLFGGAVAWAVLGWFQRHDSRFLAHYLMKDYAYSASHRGANPPALEERMRVFADKVAAALKEDADEVLVIGHSSGAHLAISILADVLRSGRVPAEGPDLSLLTLGQVVPMVSFLPEAHRLRADLRYLSDSDAVTWVDVTAPGDGCSFSLCDPVSVSGVALPGKKWPLVFSAAFTQTLSPARWKALRWRFFTLHFQYLCAFDRPKDYDYFQITAGPVTLGARYAGRPHSPSRIETPASGFRSVAP